MNKFESLENTATTIHKQKLSVTAEIRLTNYDEIVKRTNRHHELTKELKENLEALAKLQLIAVTSLKEEE